MLMVGKDAAATLINVSCTPDSVLSTFCTSCNKPTSHMLKAQLRSTKPAVLGAENDLTVAGNIVAHPVTVFEEPQCHSEWPCEQVIDITAFGLCGPIVSKRCHAHFFNHCVPN